MLSGGTDGGPAFGAEMPKPGGEVLKYEEPRHLTASIYTPGSNQLLFKFKRTATRRAR